MAWENWEILLSWLVVFLVVPFNKIQPFSNYLTTFRISFVSLFVRVILVPNFLVGSDKMFLESGKIFLEISSNDTLLDNSFALLAISYATSARFMRLGMLNPPDCILQNWVFENFILAVELFGKTLRSLETCVSVNNNWCGKLVLSLEFTIKFD